jgi:hypothetical protein
MRCVEALLLVLQRLQLEVKVETVDEMKIATSSKMYCSIVWTLSIELKTHATEK